MKLPLFHATIYSLNMKKTKKQTQTENDDSDDVECVESGALLVSGVHTNSTITAGRAGSPFLSVQLCRIKFA